MAAFSSVNDWDRLEPIFAFFLSYPPIYIILGTVNTYHFSQYLFRFLIMAFSMVQINALYFMTQPRYIEKEVVGINALFTGLMFLSQIGSYTL